MLFIQTAAMKTARIEDRASSQYHADQNRAMQARAIDPSLADLKTQSTSHDGRVFQPAMRAVERIADTATDAPVYRKMNDELKLSRVTVSAPAQTGAPVNLTMADFRRLSKDDQQRVMVQVANYAGARARMSPDGSGRSLTDAFAAELDYQRGVVRRAAAAMRDGKKERFTREQSKKDKKAGRPKTPAPGVASFTRGGVRMAAVDLPRGVEVTSRRLKRGEIGLIVTC